MPDLAICTTPDVFQLVNGACVQFAQELVFDICVPYAYLFFAIICTLPFAQVIFSL